MRLLELLSFQQPPFVCGDSYLMTEHFPYGSLEVWVQGSTCLGLTGLPVRDDTGQHLRLVWSMSNYSPPTCLLQSRASSSGPKELFLIKKGEYDEQISCFVGEGPLGCCYLTHLYGGPEVPITPINHSMQQHRITIKRAKQKVKTLSF